MSSDGRVRGNAQSSGPIFFATVPLHHHSALLNIYKHGSPGQPRDALRALISEVRWIINITRRLCRNVWKGRRCNFDQLWSTHHVAKFGWIYEQKMLRRRAAERHVKKCMRTSWRGPPKKNTIVVDLADMGRIVFLLRSISIQLVAPNCNNEVVNGTMEH